MALRLGPMQLQSANPADAVEGYMAQPMAAPGPVRFKPGPTMEQAKEWSPSILAIIDGVLGGSTITEARRREIARHQAMQDEALRQGLAYDVLGQDPREILTYLTDPEAWAGQSSRNYAPITAGEGQTVMRPGEEPVTTPKTGVAGDTFYTQTPQGVAQTGRRAPSYAEVQDAENARIRAIQDQRELEAKIANWSEGRAIQRARAGGGGGGGGAVPSFGDGGRSSVARVRSPQELASVPSGGLYMGPDGVTRRKP